MAPMLWYLLIHQLPVRPLYFRARIRRALRDAGAVPLKKAVYALPRSPAALERLTRIREEIEAGGGEAFVCEASFTDERQAARLAEAYAPPAARRSAGAAASLTGRTWVTRRGLHVDRLACAWVVRR